MRDLNQRLTSKLTRTLDEFSQLKERHRLALSVLVAKDDQLRRLRRELSAFAVLSQLPPQNRQGDDAKGVLPSEQRVVRACSSSDRCGESIEFSADLLPQGIMASIQGISLICPVLTGIEPDRQVHQVGRFPLEARPYMGVQESVGVAKDLQIHPAECRVKAPTGMLNGFTEHVHIGQERQPLPLRKLGQPLHTGVVHQEHRVARQELNVSDHREPCLQPPEHRRVLPRRALPIRSVRHSLVMEETYAPAIKGAQSALWGDKQVLMSHQGDQQGRDPE